MNERISVKWVQIYRSIAQSAVFEIRTVDMIYIVKCETVFRSIESIFFHMKDNNLKQVTFRMICEDNIFQIQNTMRYDK